MSHLVVYPETICISDLSLNVRQQFGKTIDRIVCKTKTKSFQGDFPVTISSGSAHKHVFNPPPELSVTDRLFISLHYQSRVFGIQRCIKIAPELRNVVAEAQDDNHGRKTYFKLYQNAIEVTIGISYSAPGSISHDAPLPSTTSDIPRTSSLNAPPSRTGIQKTSLPLPSTTGDVFGTSSLGAPPPDSASTHDTSSLLSSTTADILKICPRFRLLIIGNTGVGKSTLIRKVFGVKDVDVSESSRGQANIDQEFVAEENELFVLHDSRGLEAGDTRNFDEIRRFINNRENMKDLKDKLHAVWVCLSVPHADGRLLETGMEDSLRKKNEIPGNVPTVVVLTKLDLLDKKLFHQHCKPGSVKSINEAFPIIEPLRAKFLADQCTKRLQDVAGNITHVPVSTTPWFQPDQTIPDLVRITISEIENYVRADPSYATEMAARSSLERDAPAILAGMAQRASIERKVSLTISLGKKRYWANLSTCVTFSPERVRKHLLAIHEDVVKTWNFNDPEKVLEGDSFKKALLETVNLGVRDIRNVQEAVAPVMPLVSGLGALMSDLIGVAIALPVAGALMLPMLLVEVFKASDTIVKPFMAYIVDLVYVMKILFILVPEGPITSENVAFALKVYEISSYRNRVHLEIRDFCAHFKVIPGRDAVMDEIETLINRYGITDAEVTRARKDVRLAGAGSAS